MALGRVCSEAEAPVGGPAEPQPEANQPSGSWLQVGVSLCVSPHFPMESVESAGDANVAARALAISSCSHFEASFVNGVISLGWCQKSLRFRWNLM